MTPEDDRRIADIFEQAVDLPPAERGAFVERACGDEGTVRREVEALLALDAEIEAGAGSPLWSPSVVASLGTLGAPGRVGPYRLVAKLGEGGMSEVFLGLRDDGEFVRRVAIKLIRREVLTADTMRRFETERQILASLDHPSIAKLLDAGRTADGVPYFIMEYIEGEPIDLYCDRHRLTVAERLELFRQVCLAVHFAHQNLVVHRDIKPSNILVTEAGQPKLLDFGIAKLLNPDLMIRASEPTVSWGRLLTPQYASPEQILGKTVTSASDVYALGVLLFKLLTGADPYRLREQPAPELEPLILTVEPDTPSAFVRRLLETPQDSDASRKAASDLAVQRGAQPHALVRAFAGDLDAITAKALRKEPQHRYVSAEQMAEDLRRHLAGGHVLAPQEAMPLPWTEFLRLRLRWFTVLLALLLLTAIGMLVLQTARLAETRAMAEREQTRTEEIVTSIERVFEEMPLDLAPGQEAASRELFVHAAQVFQQDLAGQPETRADLMMTLGRAYFRVGLLAEAADSFQTAVAIRQRRFGAEHEAVAECLTALAVVDASQGNLKDAQNLHARALAIRRKISAGDNLAVTENLVGLGRAFLADEHAAIAEPLLQEAYLTRVRLLDPWDVRVAEALADLGHAVRELGNPSAAELLFSEVVKKQRRASGTENWQVAINLVNQATVMFELGKRQEGKDLLQEVSQIERRLCDEPSSDLARSLLNVAAAALRGTPWDRLAASFRPSAAAGCQMPPLAVPHLTYLIRGLGISLSELGYTAEAGRLLQQVGTSHKPATPPLLPGPGSSRMAGECVPDGGFADALKNRCCSGVVVPGSTVCRDPDEWGNAWRTCRYVCGSRLVNGCVPPGGVDDVLSLTDCCSGASVNGSTRCLNPADEGTSWRSCVNTCA